MEKDFSKNLIKSYTFWELYIHENQGYLGRCVIWCKRDNAIDLTGATPDEQRELFVVLNDLKKALIVCFNPDWFNYSFLGNKTRHLHGHFIPRYKKSRNFESIVFEDKLFGHSYKTDHTFITSEEVLQKVRDSIKSALG